MAASKKTVEQVYAAIVAHVPYAVRQALFNDLSKIDGNASFKLTVRALIDQEKHQTTGDNR